MEDGHNLLRAVRQHDRLLHELDVRTRRAVVDQPTENEASLVLRLVGFDEQL
jgi:hypothetical protein